MLLSFCPLCTRKCCFSRDAWRSSAVESSNRGRGRGWESRPLSRFCFALVLKRFSTLQHHYRAVEPPKWFRTRRLRTPTCVWMQDRASQGPPNRTPYRRGGPVDSVAFNRLRGPLSRDVALSAPKSAVLFSGIFESKSAVFFPGILLALHPLFLTMSSCLAPWLAQLNLDKPPSWAAAAAQSRRIFFDVSKGGHIPPTPSSGPMSQRSQRHRRTTRIHIQNLSLQTRGRNTITRQQPHYITQFNSREIFLCICNGTHCTN